MLAIRGTKSNKKALRGTVTAAAVLLLLGGLYLLTLVSAPAIAPVIAQKPIVVTELPKPTAAENRIVIPKLGVNIPYAPGEASLDRGAEWRHPTRGNPVDGGKAKLVIRLSVTLLYTSKTIPRRLNRVRSAPKFNVLDRSHFNSGLGIKVF